MAEPTALDELAEIMRFTNLAFAHQKIHMAGLGCCCLGPKEHPPCPKCPTHNKREE